MSLKILIFPVIIVIALTLAIGYIKPDITTMLEKRAEIEKKTADLAKVDSIIQNIRRLHAEVDQRRESESFVLRYIPRSLEEERVLDAFNFLASQSGVIVTDADVKENEPMQKELPPVLHASMSFQALTDANQAAAVVVPEVPKRTVESYRASVQVLGSYQSIKDFFARLNRTDRAHQMIRFGIQERTDEGLTDEEKAAIPADFLEAVLEADFSHFRPLSIVSALEHPLFQGSNFDFAVVDDLLAFVNSPLPALETGQTGRANPFQP